VVLICAVNPAQMTRLLRVVGGALIAILASFPLAALTALVFRFPIPFGGYVSGPEAVGPVLYAVGFYGLLGGFFVQAVVGGVAALVASRSAPRGSMRWVAAAVAAAWAGVLLLSILDWIIGDW
jgi:hypothetical protein